MSSASTYDLVLNWTNSRMSLQYQRKSLATAIEDHKKAGDELAERLIPSDAKPGEVFCCWVRINSKQERLVSVTVLGPGDYLMRFR